MWHRRTLRWCGSPAKGIGEPRNPIKDGCLVRHSDFPIAIPILGSYLFYYVWYDDVYLFMRIPLIWGCLLERNVSEAVCPRGSNLQCILILYYLLSLPSSGYDLCGIKVVITLGDVFIGALSWRVCERARGEIRFCSWRIARLGAVEKTLVLFLWP